MCPICHSSLCNGSCKYRPDQYQNAAAEMFDVLPSEVGGEVKQPQPEQPTAFPPADGSNYGIDLPDPPEPVTWTEIVLLVVSTALVTYCLYRAVLADCGF